MSRTIIIHGSDKEVMAMFGQSGHYYRGRWQNVKITGIDDNEEIPLDVRKSLVGLVIPTIFTKEQIESETGKTFPITERSRLAYSQDVISALKKTGKLKEANQLIQLLPEQLDMYYLKEEIYKLV